LSYISTMQLSIRAPVHSGVGPVKQNTLILPTLCDGLNYNKMSKTNQYQLPVNCST